MWRMSRDKGITVAELLELDPYEMTLEWLAREAFLSEAAGEMRRLQAQGGGPSTGVYRFTWQVN